MFGRIIRILFRLGTYLALAGAAVLVLPRLITSLHSLPRLRDVEEVTPVQFAIVFGAGVRRDGSPTPVLRDRVTTAVHLYQDGKVERLLMSGYDTEPVVMRDYALLLGVPREVILMDAGGARTYDTCYRAREVFGVQEAVLVTQAFHLPRALYTCSALQVQSQGVAAENNNYRQRSETFWNIRETFATLVALWDVHISNPIPMEIDSQAYLLSTE